MHGWVMKYLFYGIMFIGWVGFTLLRDKKSQMVVLAKGTASMGQKSPSRYLK